MLAVVLPAVSWWVREWLQSGPAGAGHGYEDAKGNGAGGGVGHYEDGGWRSLENYQQMVSDSVSI